MIRVNRYLVRGRWFWRVWRKSEVIAKCSRSYDDSDKMERDLQTLFPQWVRKSR